MRPSSSRMRAAAIVVVFAAHELPAPRRITRPSAPQARRLRSPKVIAVMTPRFHDAVRLLAGALILSACAAPGEGPKALAGFKASAAIIQALGEYRSKNGAYPDALGSLVPAFATSLQLTPPHDVARFDYGRKGDGFAFGFGYYGPGANTCSFDSALRSWACSGYF